MPYRFTFYGHGAKPRKRCTSDAAVTPLIGYANVFRPDLMTD